MTLKDLDELLAQAVHARDGTGRSVIAERLLLYRRIVDAFSLLVAREQAQRTSLQALRPHAQALTRALNDITARRTSGGPTVDQVSTYYQAAAQFREAVRQIQQSHSSLTEK